MARNSAAEKILHGALVYELEQHIERSKRVVKNPNGANLAPASRRSIAKGSKIDGKSGTIYRIMRTKGRIPSPDTLATQVAPICWDAARWLRLDLRRALDARATEMELIDMRNAIMTALDPEFYSLEWDCAGLTLGVGVFVHEYAQHFHEVLVLELGSLRGRPNIRARYFQCGVVRCILAELALRAPAFAHIERALTKHVIDTLFPPKEFFARFAYGGPAGSSYSRFHRSAFIAPEELDAMYEPWGAWRLGVSLAYIPKDWRLRDIQSHVLAQEAMRWRTRRRRSSLGQENVPHHAAKRIAPRVRLRRG